MNNDAEAINLLNWLLQEQDPAISAPSGNPFVKGAGAEQTASADLPSTYLDPLDSEEVDAMATHLQESGSFPLNSGEIPAVQDRFDTLIKDRLRAEIERNPPLFPWETEVCHYEDTLEPVTPSLIPAYMWTAQLQSMDLPVPMPEALLSRLFEQCQMVVQSSLREGVKLVQAVEALFPGQTQALNQLASLVLTSPTRSGGASLSTATQDSVKFPSHYDAASFTQQMALSLMTARKILEATTLKPSLQQPQVERLWATAVGPLKLIVNYEAQRQALEIHGQFPCPGQLCFYGDEGEAIASCDGGALTMPVSGIKANQTYRLDVLLNENEQPLVLAVCPVAEV